MIRQAKAIEKLTKWLEGKVVFEENIVADIYRVEESSRFGQKVNALREGTTEVVGLHVQIFIPVEMLEEED